MIYLVEDLYRFMDRGLHEHALHKSLANTRLHDGCIVYETSGMTGTVAFLVSMTRALQSAYEVLSTCHSPFSVQ